MRTVLILPFLALLLAGCASQPEPQPAPPNPVAQKAVFQGTLPCADCAGIKNTLTLYRDQYDQPTRFKLKQKYIGGKDDLIILGHGNWNIKSSTQTGVKGREEVFVLNPDFPDDRKLFLHKAANAVELLNKNGSQSTSDMNYTLMKK